MVKQITRRRGATSSTETLMATSDQGLDSYYLIDLLVGTKENFGPKAYDKVLSELQEKHKGNSLSSYLISDASSKVDDILDKTAARLIVAAELAEELGSDFKGPEDRARAADKTVKMVTEGVSEERKNNIFNQVILSTTEGEDKARNVELRAATISKTFLDMARRRNVAQEYAASSPTVAPKATKKPGLTHG